MYVLCGNRNHINFVQMFHPLNLVKSTTSLHCFCCVHFRSLHEELRSVEESRRHQIHLFKKQEDDCSMQLGERRVMDGLCQDLSRRKEAISVEIRVNPCCSVHIGECVL